MDKPPALTDGDIDYDRFHDLMHRPFTATCRSRYGGSRYHLWLWWEFVARPVFARQLKCRFGVHRWCDGWSSELGDTWICGDCREKKEK